MSRKNLKYEDNSSSIKYYVKRFLLDNTTKFKNKKIIDFPAGNGITSRILKENGAEPIPLDLFPEYFNIDGLNCVRANIQEGLPLKNNFADGMVSQEGIEHFSDQFGALKEFNRVLKPGATLLITTPNYSNLRARMSYFLSESERFNSTMPPNELDSIWMSKKEITSEIYFGHIFLIGIQKLRTLAKLAGFKLIKFHFTKTKTTSLLMLPFYYPFIYFSNLISYRKNMRKNKDFDYATKKKVYGEVFKLAVNPKILVAMNLMVEFEKEQDFDEVNQQLRSVHKEFGRT